MCQQREGESEREERLLTSTKSFIFSSNNGTCSRPTSGAADGMGAIVNGRALVASGALDRGKTHRISPFNRSIEFSSFRVLVRFGGSDGSGLAGRG